MKFRCERDALADALHTAARAASSSKVGWANALLLELDGNTLTVTGSDLDLTIRTQVQVSASQSGSALPMAFVGNLVKALESGPVAVETDGPNLVLSAGRSQFKVSCYPVKDFPRIHEPEGSVIKIQVQDFAQALSQVTRSACSDQGRPILCGVLLTAEEKGLSLVATDSFRLSLRTVPSQLLQKLGEERVLVPARSLTELERILDKKTTEMEVALGVRDMAFQVGSTRIMTRLITGEYPLYQKLLPTSSLTQWTVNRLDLMAVVKRVGLMAREENVPVRFVLRTAQDVVDLRVQAPGGGTATDEVQSKVEGQDLELAFRPDFLLEGLDAFTTDEVRFEMNSELKPVLIKPVVDSDQVEDFVYLIMPFKVNKNV